MGLRNRERLQGIDPHLRDLVLAVADIYPIVVLEGRRSKERQLALFKAGKSKTLNSKHLLGLAVDIAPDPIRWDSTLDFAVLAGVVLAEARLLDIRVRWGGSWRFPSNSATPFLNFGNSFNDLVHFELM